MRGILLLAQGLLVALLVTGCAAPRVGDRPAPQAEAQAEQPFEPEPEDGTISAELYQPTLHGILAVHGGFGAPTDAAPVNTRWRRGGSGQEFTLRLDPNEVTVQPLEPGRYTIIAAEGGGRDDLEFADKSGKPRSATVVIDPGEVVYAGEIFIREATIKTKPAKKDPKQKTPPPPASREVLVIEVKDRADLAKIALSERYPQQARAMKKRLLAAR